MKPETRILFAAQEDGKNIHEWGTIKDTILRSGNTAYLLEYIHKNEKYGDNVRLIIVEPHQIELIEG
jgi:hypothetical protein